jgi:hypothetical protein
MSPCYSGEWKATLASGRGARGRRAARGARAFRRRVPLGRRAAAGLGAAMSQPVVADLLGQLEEMMSLGKHGGRLCRAVPRHCPDFLGRSQDFRVGYLVVFVCNHLPHLQLQDTLNSGAPYNIGRAG